MTNEPPHYEAIVSAPFGSVGVRVKGLQVIVELLPAVLPAKASQNRTAQMVAQQIEAYLQSRFNTFNLPIMHRGSLFQQRVWGAISAIPAGETRTYGEIASELGSAPRAVANACGANHLPLVVPCHRVVAKKGLGGFMRGAEGGLAIKTWLLKHEGVQL